MSNKVEKENPSQKKYATAEQVAHILNITPRWIQRLVKENGMPRELHGQYDLVKVVRWYIDFLRKQIDEAKKGNESLSDAKLRLTKTRADREAVELEEKQKNLIPVKLSEEIIIGLQIAWLKKLDGLPAKTANKLFAAKSKKEIMDIQTEAITEIKNDISGIDFRKQLSYTTANTRKDS